MSRQREPIDLLLAKGKKHLTKEEIKERKLYELDTEKIKNNIVAPEYLSETQKEEFDKISHKLSKIGIMTELDCDCLARYIISKRLYLKYTSLLTKEINKGNLEKIEKYTAIQDKMFKQCRSSANDLGLTITSRCRLIVPKVPDEPKVNKFDKFKVVNS